MSFAPAQDQLVGRTLGEFVLRERIGQGGFGAVYRATQPALDREAVVKVLHSHLHASHAAIERFLREARLASKLDHPFAAHVYAFGAEPDGELWIAMELVRGTPLDQVLRLQGPIPLERLVPLLDRICEVVHTAHEQGMVHRDLKPANVMVLARAGRLLPKLLDFGIAKGLADAAPDELEYQDTGLVQTLDDLPVPPGTQTAHDLTQRGAIIGSPPYMAPEQWVDAGHVDARTDLYALGALAYECLTGKPPFSGDTVTMIAVAHANEPVPALPPAFPSALDQVFAKVLAKRAEDRYADTLEFAKAFRQASGLDGDKAALPRVDAAVRDAVVRGAPQPIAEALLALEAARNVHQARDAVVQLARTITRYLGLLALACRSHVWSGDDLAVADAVRALYRRPLTELEWVDLARALTSVWLDRRDAYPVPELVDALHDRALVGALEALASLRERDVPGEDELLELLEQAIARATQLLDGLAFLADYPLVVMQAGGEAEVWMGVRRPQRPVTAVRGKRLPAGVPALLDSEGAPVLSLAPLIQAAPPTPGAPAELFLFDGRDPRGAKLVALPAGFEHHDDALWDWFRLQLAETFDDPGARVADEHPPYRGLQPFSSEDGASFYGREKQVDAFLNRLQLQPLLAVVGRSGAGKSSFVYAGVIPALPAGWRAITMRPGASPLRALVSRLEHAGFAPIARGTLAEDPDALGEHLRGDAAGRGPVLLVVDQLEEMFTLCDDATERRAFAEAIAAAARSAVDPVRVIFTLRDDFLVRTEQVPALRNRIGQGLQLLTVPAAEDLRRILVEPARRAGYEFQDPELPDEMVREVADQPGALALISFTAAKLWELRDRQFKQLTRTAYAALGGVGGALARHADVTLDAMPPEERALAREAFRHLVTTQHTRAVLTRKDLRQLLGGSEHAERLIEQLIAARLLVASENETGDETVEIVHEALLTAWPRLVAWRHEDAEGARFREQLRSAAEQWHQRGRARGLLWRGEALAEYTRWRARHPGPLTDRESEFAAATLADAARGRRNRRLLLAAAFTALLAVVAGLIVFNARITRQRAETEQANDELHRTLEREYEAEGRRLVLDGQPLEALAYLEKAASAGAHGWAHDFLVAEAIRDSDGLDFEVHHDLPVTTVRFSPDGTRLATAGFDHRARIWDARTGSPLLVLAHGDAVFQANYSPDGATILTSSADKTAALWDARTGKQLHVFHHAGAVRCALYSPDGTLALTAGEDDLVAAWDVASGAQVWSAHGTGGGVPSANSCAISHDGDVVAVGDDRGAVRLYRLRDGKLLHELHGHPESVRRVRFLAGHDRLVTASRDGTALVWNTRTGKLAFRIASEDANIIEPSPDGRRIATSSTDHTATLWDAATGKRIRVLAGQTAALEEIAFSPDGSELVTASEDRTAALWDVASGRMLARWRGHEDGVSAAVFDRSGAHVATASTDGSAIVWDVRPQHVELWLHGHSGAIYDASFSPDGDRLITAAADGAVRVLDATTGRVLATLPHHGDVYSASWAPSAREIATGAEDGTVRIWDVREARVVATLDTGGPVAISQLSWSPDGARLVVASEDGWLRCFERTTAHLVFAKHMPYSLRSASFSRSGTLLVTSGDDPAIQIWTPDGELVRSYTDPDSKLHVSAEFDPSGTRLLIAYGKAAKIVDLGGIRSPIELQGHDGFVAGATWSPDGRMAITASLDGTARLWDASTGAMLAIFRHTGPVSYAGFSPDGRHVVIVGRDGGGSIRELPSYRGTRAALDELLRCRVPYAVQGDGLVPRKRDEHECRGAR